MASSSSASATSDLKRQKLTNEEQVGGSVVDDKLSYLPDSVLLHILSFLPAKYVVTTGILSKRWDSLWTNVLSLDFDEENNHHIRFTNFVNRVLLHHNSKSLHKFSLKCGSRIDLFDVKSWVVMAVSRNVQELSINRDYPDLDVDSPLHLPRCVFNCKTLVALKLCGNVTISVLPTSVCIPNLKALHLHSVQYQNDESVRKLISGCLVLENLYIRRDEFDNVEVFHVSAPALKHLKIDFLGWYEDEFHGYNTVLYIDTPILQYLDMIDYISKRILVTNFCSLIKANVGSNDAKGYSSFPESMLKCLGAFSTVKFLYLSGSISTKALDLVPGLLSTKFLNLTHLTMGVSCAWHPLLLYFLETSDNLEVLKLTKCGCFWSRRGGNPAIEPEHVPRCLLSSLRALSLEDFWGLEHELAMLKYILKNGKVLETVEIHYSSSLFALSHCLIASTTYCRTVGCEFEQKFHLAQKILKLPRGSEVCEIAFS